MINFKWTLRLLSDAEPGTGLGSEALENLVPRDERGRAFIPASHIKGLIRDRLRALSTIRGWSEDLETGLLGGIQNGELRNVEASSALQLSDALSKETAPAPVVITISRTRLTRLGVAEGKTLRTVEAISAGTALSGQLWLNAEKDSALDLAARLSLMAIEAVGGGRNRGAGRCTIAIEGEARSPGALLQALDDVAKKFHHAVIEPTASKNHELEPGEEKWFRLVFHAEDPVCCSEVPINGSTNHLRSGPVIPASAVQGALITLLDRSSSSMATACLLDSRFRAWPLVPVAPAFDQSETNTDTKNLPFGVRVDLAHRMSKLADTKTKQHDFYDAAVAPYHWSDVAGSSPLRSTDGVLRQHPDGTVDLWKAAELPRRIIAHGVHHGANRKVERNLFSVEALAPLIFTGLVALPPQAASELQRLLKRDSMVAFGKARSIRGRGQLSLKPVDPNDLFRSNLPDDAKNRVFVVQSPLAIPDEHDVQRADKALNRLIEKAGWGVALLDDDEMENVPRTLASCGVRFGWNRHGLGDRAHSQQRRLRARRVILPGSVVVLKKPLENVAKKLLDGVGEGRELGYGALLPHPGIAQDLYPREPEASQSIGARNQAGRQGYEWFEKAGQAKGPAAAQIAAVARRIEGKEGKQKAVEYLKRQKERGAVQHWHRWAPVIDSVISLIQKEPQVAAEALRVWQDLAVIHRPSNEVW